MRSNFQQIESYCIGLCTQNPGLREVDLEPSPERGIDKINMQKQEKNTQKKASHIPQPGLTYGSQHVERWTWNPVLRDEPIGALFCLKQQEFQIYSHWRLLNSWITSLLQDMEQLL